MKTKFEEYVEDIDNMIKEYTKKLHISDLDSIVESIEDSPAGTGKMDFWLEDIVDSEQLSRKRGE
mgnify:FL=1|jgi:hypothetical protein|tara:strand:- start:55 stop:249 length:195 start_codon:yes stop_codon:yes gene_type:complete